MKDDKYHKAMINKKKCLILPDIEKNTIVYR